MKDLTGIGVIILIGCALVSMYVKKWKRDNPGEPVFEWLDNARGNSFDDQTGETDLTSSSYSPDDKWLSPGGCTTEFYDCSRLRDEDSHRDL